MDLDQNGFDLSKPSIHNNVVRKLPLPKCDLTNRGTFGIEESCTIVVNEEACSQFLCLTSRGGRRLKCNLVDGSGLTSSNMIRLESSGSCEELGNLRVVLDFKNQNYVLDKPLPTALPEGFSPEERITFEKWLEDNRKVHSIILASMTNNIQKQYDRLDDVPSIILLMKELYAVSDRHIRYAATNPLFGTKLAEVTSSIYDPFIINYNMNGLEKSIHELINMLGPIRGTASTGGVPAAPMGKSKGKWKVGGSQGSKANDVYMKTTYLQPRSERSRMLCKDEMILRLGDGNAVTAEAVGSLSLVISDHIQIELKDCYYVPSMIKNIIFITVLGNDGYAFMINKNSFYLMIDNNSHLLGTLVNGLYILQQSNWIMAAQHKRKFDNYENAWLWHARLGHISKDRIRKLVDSKSLE
ncbi:UNVERIFIED_CONTAM: hypothetical protein Slati_4238500, partial [Sesamum latifolium]